MNDMSKGILKFKSKNMKYSYRITNYEAALLLGHLTQISPNLKTSTERERDDKGHFLPVDEPAQPQTDKDKS